MTSRLFGALIGGALHVAIGSGSAFSQSPPTPSSPATTPAPPTAPPAAPATSAEKETWKAPFGGTFSATFTFATDYSYRGISQTQRQVAAQAAFGYETPSLLLGQDGALSAYLGGWGSNVNFPGTGTAAEVDLLAGFKLKALSDKLTVDLGYIRYNYLGAPANLFYDFNEFGLVAAYDFGVAQVSGALRYSPNFFANSGNAWYKWGQVAVPLTFINFNENVTFKLFGTIGNQYVERYAFYGIPYDNYWDWQVGLTANVYGFDLSIAYVDTNIDIQGCLNTYNCEARAIFTLSKSF